MFADNSPGVRRRTLSRKLAPGRPTTSPRLIAMCLIFDKQAKVSRKSEDCGVMARR
jgi:hypothetical protein